MAGILRLTQVSESGMRPCRIAERDENQMFDEFGGVVVVLERFRIQGFPWAEH